MSVKDTKQVMVMRTKFFDDEGNQISPRKGKYIAQACHASISFLTKRLESKQELTTAMKEWMEESFAKICLQVDTEEDLLNVYEKAKQANLEVHLSTDSGRTEFKKPAITCLAIGPDYVENIDPVTKDLKLF